MKSEKYEKQNGESLKNEMVKGILHHTALVAHSLHELSGGWGWTNFTTSKHLNVCMQHKFRMGRQMTYEEAICVCS